MGKVKKIKNSESSNIKQLKKVDEKSKNNVNKAKDVKPVPAEAAKQDSTPDKIKKEKKQKPNKKIPQEEVSNDVKKNTDYVELDPKVLAKIEKKKAKKLAKKLKKKQLKEQQETALESSPAKTNHQNVEVKSSKKSPEKQGEPSNKNPNNSSKDTLPKKSPLKNKKKISKAKPEDGTERNHRDPAVIAATIFIGNLPVTVKRVQIVKLLAKIGKVQSIRLRTAAGQVIFKHKQRKLAGSLNAYVVLENAEIAQKALQLNGTEFKGNHLRVTPADAQKTQSGHDPKRTIFLGNLKYSANEKKLHEIFSNCGEIDYIRCLGNGKNGCNGVAYVCFKSPEAVGLALELNETLLDERPIHVERYSTKKLGAKEAREKQAALTQKHHSSGAKKRIDAKQLNKTSDKKKKSEFRGVKTTLTKNKKQHKKQNNEMKGLAKKIAPKIKKQE